MHEGNIRFMDPQFTNRLIYEKSPYLLQHSHNPVDWYPWGEEAFLQAKRSDKPIFLSIGYATCHWCHVMEEESFEDIDVAKALNDAFVCIKVDREELPEIDSLYMEFAQTMLVGSAGWPLNLILTPDLKPFFAATYLPKNTSRGMIGVIDLSDKIQNLWRGEDRERILGQADRIVDILKAHVHTIGDTMPKESTVSQTADILFKIADPTWGGMKGAPKFPLGYQANFLLRYFLRSQDSRALFLVEKTLDMMHRGGIYDHIGGGFARYSVDEQWQVPHFEKMLYDNAISSYGYLEAWKVTKRPLYAQVSQEILDYIAREMQFFEGGFYSAEDADTENVEGLFYTWTMQEIVDVLGIDQGQLFCDFFGVLESGPLEGRNVLHMPYSYEEFANLRGFDVEFLRQTIKKMLAQLFLIRSQRKKPFKDDKIIASWNGLAIFAFIEAGFSFQRPDYIHVAVKAAQFIKKHMWKDGILYRRYRDDEVRFMATLDDYAFLIRGLISLFERTGEISWLQWALELVNALKFDFKEQHGAFYQASEYEESLLIRKTQFADGAEPSGNAIHAENLLRLYQITASRDFLEQAEDILKASEKYISTYPLGYCYNLVALERYFDKNKALVVILKSPDPQENEEITNAIIQKVLPHFSFVMLDPAQAKSAKFVPSFAQYEAKDGLATMYICKEGVCLPPVVGKTNIVDSITNF